MFHALSNDANAESGQCTGTFISWHVVDLNFSSLHYN